MFTIMALSRQVHYHFKCNVICNYIYLVKSKSNGKWSNGTVLPNIEMGNKIIL